MNLYLKDVLELLEEIAPAELAEPWDNPGLQIGVIDQEIKSIYFALDPTLNSIKKAIACNADLLMTHHPLIFRSISKLTIDEYPGNVIKEALIHNISVICAHTNLDSAPGGLNDILAEILELKQTEVLKENQKFENAGLGRIGTLNYKIYLKDFLELIKKKFKVKKIRVICDSIEKDINRVAIVGGAGGSLISSAIKKGADVLITGDIGYHDALNALSYGLILIDVGHFATENYAFNIFGKKIGSILKDKGFNVEIILDHEESDPFYTI